MRSLVLSVSLVLLVKLASCSKYPFSGFSYTLVQKHPNKDNKLPSYTFLKKHSFKPFSFPEDKKQSDKQSEAMTPNCSNGTTTCEEDEDYPKVQLKTTIETRINEFMSYFADAVETTTATSVEGIKKLKEEKFLCPSKVLYAKPLRAKNTDGKWKIIVNLEHFSQTIRMEECTSAGTPCPMLASCFDTTCVQKHSIHRLVTFDPKNFFRPFHVDVFRFPSGCSCLLGKAWL